jgi:hypothetical protein
MGPPLDPHKKIWITVLGCLCLRGYMVAYIDRWNEPEPSDQTDLSNGVDWTSMAVENWLAKDVDRWDPPRSADLGVGRSTWLNARWAPPSEGRLLVSSIVFWYWGCGSNLFLISVCLFGECDSGLGTIFWINPLALYKSSKLIEFISLNP